MPPSGQNGTLLGICMKLCCTGTVLPNLPIFLFSINMWWALHIIPGRNKKASVGGWKTAFQALVNLSCKCKLVFQGAFILPARGPLHGRCQEISITINGPPQRIFCSSQSFVMNNLPPQPQDILSTDVLSVLTANTQDVGLSCVSIDLV